MNKSIHFVGIGGIGMSALARILHAHGYTISGCDTNLKQETIVQLQTLGCTIYLQNTTHHCPLLEKSTIVYSTAITVTNPDLIFAQQHNMQLLHRSKVLAHIMQSGYSIAVTGSHGKTTTTSLLGHLLLYTGHNPTIISGGIIHSIASNAHVGNKNLIIAEADESDRSFLKLRPNATIITNIDFEHAETYRNLDDVLNTYKTCIDQTLAQTNGMVLINGDDDNCRQLLSEYANNVYSFGFEQNNHIVISRHEALPESSMFQLSCFPDTLFTLPLAGTHNVANAAAALGMCCLLKKDDDFVSALTRFTGVDRRFSIRGTYNGATIVDDYAHHPVEIEKTIAMARTRVKGKLIIVFQPHRYSRTKALWDDFISVLQNAPCDQIIVTDIYPASEAPIENITSTLLVQNCNTQHITHIPFLNKEILKNKIKILASPDSMILFLGAGNAYRAGLELVKQ